MNHIRREKVREFVEENQVVTLDQLTELFPEVSLMTIHRDLTFLQEQGFLVKIRGGARYIADHTSEPAFAAREIVSKEEKEKIATKAVKLLHGSSSIFVDAGTTMMAFAKEFPNLRGNIITTGPNIALDLARHPLLTVSLCGGVLNKNNLTLSGTGAMEVLSKVNIDTAFLVASGYSADCGFTCGMEAEATIKKMIARKARTTILMMDTTKFGRVLPYTFAEVKDFDYIVTEKDPDALPEHLKSLAKKDNVTIV